MVSTVSAIAASILYTASALIRSRERPGQPGRVALVSLLAAVAVTLHAVTAAQMVIRDTGIDLSLWPVSVLIFFVVNLVVLLSSIRIPVQSLFVLLFPASAVVLLLSVWAGEPAAPAEHLSWGLGLHVTFSLLAYSLFTIAAGQALMLAYQDYRLKNHHPGGFLKGLPPLQTMEALLFDVLWAGFTLLTLGLITGFAFVDNIWAQHLAHKTFFSMVGWVLFAILLVGRHRLGWRGHTAIRWTLGGFVALAVAFWGSKFVLQVLLGIDS